MNRFDTFTVINLMNYSTNLNITNSKTSSSLLLSLDHMKRIAWWSIGINKYEFPKIKYSFNKRDREKNISTININQYLKVTNLLYDNEEYEDSLSIHIMLSLVSIPNVMLTLKFWK